MLELTIKTTGTGKTVPEVKVEKNYKDRVFRMIFKEKKELLSLYNAICGRHYDNPEELEINTLENTVYMKMKNDLSFVIDLRVSLYEHQSTYNPNMPLRDLFYIADLYQIMTMNANLYGKKLVQIPTPQFVVFYNGTDPHPEKKIFSLSDAYLIKVEQPSLELKVLSLNINLGYNEELMKNCKTLRDYQAYVEKIRKYTQTMILEDAVEKSITECIEEGILAEFLKANRTEAKHMSIYEYDEEKHLQQERTQSKEEGREQEIFNSVFENDYSLERGMEKLNLSRELFEAKYQKWLLETNK